MEETVLAPSTDPLLIPTGRIMLGTSDLITEHPHPERYDCERDGMCFPLVGGA